VRGCADEYIADEYMKCFVPYVEITYTVDTMPLLVGVLITPPPSIPTTFAAVRNFYYMCIK
jgi:hypothetical protein